MELIIAYQLGGFGMRTGTHRMTVVINQVVSN